MNEPADEIWTVLDPIILRGEHITAIKMYREEKQVSLRDAKQAIERRIDELVKPK